MFCLGLFKIKVLFGLLYNFQQNKHSSPCLRYEVVRVSFDLFCLNPFLVAEPEASLLATI